MDTVLFTDKSKKGNKMDLVLFITSKGNTVQQILVHEKNGKFCFAFLTHVVYYFNIYTWLKFLSNTFKNIAKYYKFNFKRIFKN